MNEFDIMEAIKRTSEIAVPVDSGSLLVVDPCYLDTATLERLTRPNERGLTAAVIVGTPHGDGFFGIEPAPVDGELCIFRAM